LKNQQWSLTVPKHPLARGMVFIELGELWNQIYYVFNV